MMTQAIISPTNISAKITFDASAFCSSMSQLADSFRLMELEIKRTGELIYRYNSVLYLLSHKKLPGSQRTKRLRKKQRSRINKFVTKGLS